MMARMMYGDLPRVGLVLAALLLECQQYTGEAVVGLGKGLCLGQTGFSPALLCRQGLLAWRSSQLHKVQLGSLRNTLHDASGLLS